MSETPTATLHQRGKNLSLIGLLINVVLASIKLVAGLLGHSYALVADAVESSADVLVSFAVWGGLKIAEAPPDAKHPYGHGKAEALAGLIVAGILVTAGLGIAIAAVREILSDEIHGPAAYTLWVLIGVVIVKEFLFRAGRRIFEGSKSSAVFADAWHHRSDAITSAAAALGISIALIGGPAYAAADSIAALFASVIIVLNAARILRQPLHELMDAAPSPLINKVREVAGQVQGVKAVESVQARKSGIEYWVDMHIEVDPEMSVRDGHALAHDVKEVVQRAIPSVADVLIHVEPYPQKRNAADVGDEAEGEQVRDRFGLGT